MRQPGLPERLAGIEEWLDGLSDVQGAGDAAGHATAEVRMRSLLERLVEVEDALERRRAETRAELDRLARSTARVVHQAPRTSTLDRVV